MNGRFLGHFTLEYLGPNRYRYLPEKENPLIYMNNQVCLVLSEEMETDLASTPRALWWHKEFVPDAYARPALVHDYLFERNHQGHPILSFKETNALLAEMIRVEGGKYWVAWAYQKACDYGGMAIWNRGKLGAMGVDYLKIPAPFIPELYQKMVERLEQEDYSGLKEMCGQADTPAKQFTMAMILTDDRLAALVFGTPVPLEEPEPVKELEKIDVDEYLKKLSQTLKPEDL